MKQQDVAYAAGLTMAVMFWSGSVPAQQREAEPRLLQGTKVHRDLEYVKGGHERHKLDLYLPEKAAGPLPVIVWIHGGAWQGGNKNNPPGLSFVVQGYALVSINYRLSQHAKFPAQIEDCKAAIRWLRANATTYHLDPDRIGVWGASAGGHLVALLGTTGDVKELEGDGGNPQQSSEVQAVVDWFGPTDFLKIGEQSGPDSRLDHNAPNSPEAKLIGGPVLENRDKAAKASPITYVTKHAAPFLIMHGDKDPVVPYAQSEELAAALKKVDALVTLRKIEGVGHGDPGFNSPESRKAIQEFFDRHLKDKPANGKGVRTPTATPAQSLKVKKDFKVELLHSVPKEIQGSWVNLCVDPKGRLIVSDQYGPLYRITPPPLGAMSDSSFSTRGIRRALNDGSDDTSPEHTKVEKLNLPLGGAHGLLWAFNSLYVMVNEDVTPIGPDGQKIKPKHGLYRVPSRDGGDTFEQPELLREVSAGGEHGAHAIQGDRRLTVEAA